MVLSCKKALAAALIAVSCIAAVPRAAAIGQRGEKTVGLTAGYNTRNESAMAGLYFQYRLARLWRLAPDVSYVFRKDGHDAFSFNFNMHMPLSVRRNINVYPLAGLNYTSWSYTLATIAGPGGDNDDVSERYSKFGINAGGGVEIYAAENLKLFCEGRYTGASHSSTGTFTVGIGYRF